MASSHDFLSPEDLAETARQAKAGDRAAQGRLLDAFEPAVRRAAASYRGQPYHEDLLQESRLALLEALPRVDPDHPGLAGYLRAVVRSTVAQSYKAEREHQEGHVSGYAPADPDNPDGPTVFDTLSPGDVHPDFYWSRYTGNRPYLPRPGTEHWPALAEAVTEMVKLNLLNTRMLLALEAAVDPDTYGGLTADELAEAMSERAGRTVRPDSAVRSLNKGLERLEDYWSAVGAGEDPRSAIRSVRRGRTNRVPFSEGIRGVYFNPFLEEEEQEVPTRYLDPFAEVAAEDEFNAIERGENHV